MRWLALGSEGEASALSSAVWVLIYTTIDQNIAETLHRVQTYVPAGTPVFGATSFQGVFTPRGFLRGMFALIGEPADDISMRPTLIAAGERALDFEDAVANAVSAHPSPGHFLLHSTPGLEEAALAGIARHRANVPVTGGSAADDDLDESWRIFEGTDVIQRGALLVAIDGPAPIHSDFVAGYVASNTHGRVTHASGRSIYTIDGKPAAQVYNAWTNGAIAEHVDGGIVLSETTMHPLGREVARVMGVKIWLMSHPHRVRQDGSLDLFADIETGDEITLMNGSEDGLVRRARRVVNSALGRRRSPLPPAGSIMVYCGGCVGAVLDRVDDICNEHQIGVSDTPFIGIASLGEQGCFFTPEAENRHGNLMSSVLLLG